MDREDLRSLIKAGRSVMGTWVQTPSPEIVEILSLAGFDFLILDLEHGYFGAESLPNLLRAAELRGAAALVRVPQEMPEQIGKALDLGAGGVVVPDLRSAEAGRRFISMTRFPPDGVRGASISTRELGYSARPLTDILSPESRAFVVLQVEAAAALQGLEELLTIEGLDVLFIGPFDLSASLGVPGETSHPKVKEAMRGIAAQCQAAGVAVGLWVRDPEMVSEWSREGVAFFTVSNNELMLFRAAREIVLRARQSLGHLVAE